MSIMDKRNLEIKLIKLIGILDYLYSIESFSAYNQLILMYSTLLKRIESKKVEDINKFDFESIQAAFRILVEAPPKDKSLGKYILDRMQEIYEIHNSLN